MRKVVALLWVFASAEAFAGESIQFGPPVVNASVPAVSASTPWYIEFYIHDWSNTAGGNTLIFNTNWYGNALGLVGMLVPSGGASGQDLTIYSQTETQAGGACAIQVGSPANLPTQGIYVRYQHLPATTTDECEVWDTNGNRFGAGQTTYSAANPNVAGMGLGESTGFSMAFFRVCTGATIALGSRMPTTAGGCSSGSELLEWKFDGNLNDSSGNGYTGSLMSGFASYVPTPNQNVIAVIKTMGAPFWSNWVSMRAGFPAQLDGAASLSQADASNSVACFWQMLSSPAPVTWSSHTSCTPTMTGILFGDYDTQLTVTDAAGNQATMAQDIGAVATDNNGIVVQANPAADAIFGPMIAFGRNPWGLADYWAMRATSLRFQDYQSSGLSPTWPYAPWEQAQGGTVSYTWGGVGMTPTYENPPPGTTLSGSGIATATATSFTVADITKLDISELPTRVYVGTLGSYEEIYVCSASGNTLTVCYDGRGWADPSNTTKLTAQSWPAGTSIGQFKVTGTGTHFLTTLCQGGPHSPVGLVTYNTGTIALTAGSASVAGTGTVWASPSVVSGYALRVCATQGGTPFVFLAPVQTVTDATDIILSRAFPAGADSGTYSYQIISTNATASRYPVLHYARVADGSDAMQWWPNAYGCESDVSLYLEPAWDARADGTAQSGKSYGYMDQSWWINQSGTGGLNFYGEDLAHRALYLRSGYGQALTAANMIGDMWTRMPMVSNDSGYLHNAPLFLGGLVIGGFADAMLSSSGHQAQWPDLRGFATYGATNEGSDPTGTTCNTLGDNRDTGYSGAWLTLAALFDPSPSQWQTGLANWFSRENVCKGSDNSWASGYQFNNGSGALVTFTTGSSTGTGAGLPGSICAGVTSGAGSATSGSGVISGSGFTAGTRIALTGTRGGVTFAQWAFYTLNSSSQITLNRSAAWQGDSGAITWVIDNTTNALTFGQSENDPMVKENWSCTWNSATQITLNRPWDGPNGQYWGYVGNVAGWATEPYMLGIKQAGFRWGSLAATANGNSPLASNFTSLLDLAGTWENSTGFDSLATNGFYYSRAMNICEPITPASMGYGGAGPCFDDTDSYSAYNKTAMRVLTAENSSSLRSYYDAQSGSSAAVAWGDLAYGSCYGDPIYTTGGVYAATDGNTCDSGNGNLSDGSIHAGKWTGFFFGVGMAHQWPAVRLGGVAPAANRTVSVSFKLASVANAASFVAVITSPDGAQNTVACSSSPCAVSADARQGSPVIQWQYLGGAGQVLAQSDPVAVTMQ
jgi:hypothetical protein